MVIRNILLIGRIGNGKSTLANVITGTDKFKESNTSISETKDSQAEEVTIDGITYRIVDTIGIGDTRLSTRDVLYKIREAVDMVKEVHQILFVTRGRLTHEEKEAYDTLRTFFNEDIINYTTIVRTGFPDFKNFEKCLRDKSNLIEEGGSMADIVKNCKMLHVDNPPVNVGREKTRRVNEEIRAESRDVLINHLHGPNNLNNTRNILLIGRTGGGKSTLANVLVNRNNNFTEVFTEGDGSTSQTKESQEEIFTEGGIKYRVIDTIGIGDTKLTVKKVVKKIAEAAHKVEGGLHQVLFVVKSRFTKEEKEVYDLLRTAIFDEDVCRYTTIVRTSFTNFRDREKCKKDLDKLIKENKETTEMINSCGKKVLYVDNLSTAYGDVGLKARTDSRNILLTYLLACDKAYKPNNLDELNTKIGPYIAEKEKLEKQLEEQRNLSWAQKEEFSRKIEEMEKEVLTQTAQIIEQKKPGFFRSIGSQIGRGVD